MRNTRATQLLFELSKPGRRVGAHSLRRRSSDAGGETAAGCGAACRRRRRCRSWPSPTSCGTYANLSTLNMSVDTHFYPLGSCTMKYNPKRNERLASLPGIADLHPYQPEETLQGMLRTAVSSCRKCWPRFPDCRPSRCSRPPGAWRVDRADGGRGLFSRSRRKAHEGARARQRPWHQSGQCRDGRVSRP